MKPTEQELSDLQQMDPENVFIWPEATDVLRRYAERGWLYRMPGGWYTLTEAGMRAREGGYEGEEE